MSMIIDNKVVELTHSDLPILISGADKSGASFFSLSLLADFFKNGYKVLLFCAYPAAQEEFARQIGPDALRAIIIKPGDEDGFLTTIKSQDFSQETVILIKNLENYSLAVFEAVADFPRVIFSGDIDKCDFAEYLLKRDFTTKILFSDSGIIAGESIKELPKYHGRVTGLNHNGVISLQL